MKLKTTILAAGAALATLSSVVPDTAWARHHHRYYSHTRYTHRCGGGDGAVGTIAGGAGGALIGHAIGGDTLGTVAGGVGGALLGRHLDKQNTRHRNGC